MFDRGGGLFRPKLNYSIWTATPNLSYVSLNKMSEVV